jgi:hypothetical protein
MNGMTPREFEAKLDDRDAGWFAQDCDVLYGLLVLFPRADTAFHSSKEHFLCIACKHFVEAITPASPMAIRKKVTPL